MTSHSFGATLIKNNLVLDRVHPRVLQLNLGKLCNLTCSHCHVNAGPGRKEIMSRLSIDKITEWVSKNPVPLIDLTGGAPEMIPDFAYLIEQLRGIQPQCQIIDRCNLTILLEPGFEWLPHFLSDHNIEIIASMPCYSPENVNAQRGDGVFDKSIEALKLLNSIGYGKNNGQLPLHLVFNPVGPHLAGNQMELESDYKRELDKHFNITFDKLLTITNMPISRFATYLRNRGLYEDYLLLLKDSFNPNTVDGLMCRDTINVSWDGGVYDCDFNQMLDLPTFLSRDEESDGRATKLWDLDLRVLRETQIRTGTHCFGCTAGSGSSCSGALS